jgi:hypothetical protein
METTMANGNGTATKPKVELGLNESVVLKLMKDKPYSGENSFGPYYLYSVSQDDVEKAFFASPDLHKTIAEAGLRTGDEFKISKVAVQNGKKVTSKVTFEVVAKATALQTSGVPFEVPNDGFRDVMERSLRDAIEATKSVNTVQWSVDDIRSIALTIFIQRARA